MRYLFSFALFVPALVIQLFTTACVGTETGNPADDPDYTHRIEPTGVDTFVTEALTPAIPEIVISGGPGSVMPARGNVFAWPLQNNLPPVVVPVMDDGSFSLGVPALVGDLIRLQVRAEASELSPPLDILASETGSGFTRFNTALSCLRTSPQLALQLDVGREDAVIIENFCDETVVRSRARIRESVEGITLVDDEVLELPPGAQSTIRVAFEEASASPANLLFSLREPVQELRAITLGVE